MLVAIALVITGALIATGKLKEKGIKILVIVLSVVLFFAELHQDLRLYSEGVDYHTYLPFHLCNQGIFVNLIASCTKGKVYKIFSELSVVLIMPGALGAILFPDWNYRPFNDWLCYSCFFTHMLLVLLPLIYVKTKMAQIKFSHFYFSFAYIAVVTPIVYWINMKLHQNYMFLRWPVDGSPLEFVWNLSDGKYYIPGLVGLMLFVLSIEYAIIVGTSFLIKKIGQMRNKA